MCRSLVVPLLLAMAVAGCGATEAATAPGPPSTLDGIGRLPEPLTGHTATAHTASTTTATTIPRSTVLRAMELGAVGQRIEGNRVIIIGDSITASTARRHGGEMCFTLLPLGWAVEVDAEVGRFVDFGNVVLDRRLRPESGVDWDAAVVFLGSNYGGNPDRYRAELHEILDRLAPRPTVLVTVTEFRPNRADVNDAIRGMVDFYPEVQIVDWAEITRAEPALLSGDGLHLSPDGRARLAAELADALGQAPAVGDDEPEGECLSTSFTDDSNGGRPGSVIPPTLTGTGSGTTAPATSAPATTVPVPGGGSGGSGTTPAAPTTTPAATTPPPTTAPARPPDTTVAPTTAAPTTAAPTTVATVPPVTDAPPVNEPPPATEPPPPPPATDP